MTDERLMTRALMIASSNRTRPGPLTVADVVRAARSERLAPTTLVSFAWAKGYLPAWDQATIHELIAEIARIESGLASRWLAPEARLVCAWCGACNNAATTREEVATYAPQPEDAGLCANCERWNIVDDAGQFRRPSQEEIEELDEAAEDARLDAGWCANVVKEFRR
jgi:hypothetical protein